jgi:hypothetical protein
LTVGLWKLWGMINFANKALPEQATSNKKQETGNKK